MMPVSREAGIPRSTRATAKPLCSGMLMSRTNTCGCQKSSILSASTPHKANRVSSPSIAKDAANASAFHRLSSTTRTRAEFPFSGICRFLKSTGGQKMECFARLRSYGRASAACSVPEALITRCRTEPDGETGKQLYLEDCARSSARPYAWRGADAEFLKRGIQFATLHSTEKRHRIYTGLGWQGTTEMSKIVPA